ncbi:hypothetical protein PM082_007504 [Marasmius tenuissimus]|nr:hypothetical protein PM082_007504 [Marasmius tenuissimus]
MDSLRVTRCQRQSFPEPRISTHIRVRDHFQLSTFWGTETRVFLSHKKGSAFLTVALTYSFALAFPIGDAAVARREAAPAEHVARIASPDKPKDDAHGRPQGPKNRPGSKNPDTPPPQENPPPVTGSPPSVAGTPPPGSPPPVPANPPPVPESPPPAPETSTVPGNPPPVPENPPPIPGTPPAPESPPPVPGNPQNPPPGAPGYLPDAPEYPPDAPDYPSQA